MKRLYITWIARLALGVFALQVGVATANAKSTSQKLSEELAAAIAEIEANFQDTDERIQRIALLIARTTRSNPVGSATVLAELSRRVSATELPVVSAAAIMSAGTSSPAVLKAMIAAQEEEPSRVQTIRESATHPTAVLGTRTAALMQPVELAPLPEPVVAPGKEVIPPVTIPPVTIPPVTIAAVQTAPVTSPSDPEPVSVSVEATPAPAVVPAVVAAAPVARAPADETDPVALLESTEEEPVTLPQLGLPPPMQPGGLPPRPPAGPYRGQ